MRGTPFSIVVTADANVPLHWACRNAVEPNCRAMSQVSGCISKKKRGEVEWNCVENLNDTILNAPSAFAGRRTLGVPLGR